MRQLGSGDFAGRVTFITGPGRSSGKTSLLNASLAMLRQEGERPGFLAVGFEGSAKALGEGAAAQDGAQVRLHAEGPRIHVEPGEIFVGAGAWLRGSGLMPEVLAALSGSGALGRLALVRARRAGEAVLVGPDSNEAIAQAITIMRNEWEVSTVLVDGALDRVTQVASFDGARFLAAVMVDRAGLAATLSWMRRTLALSALPTLGAAEGGAGLLALDGPLTRAAAEGLPPWATTLLVDDLTKVFLGGQGLSMFLRTRTLAVRRKIEFGGFVVSLRGIGAGELREAIGTSIPGELLFASPCEVQDAA
ncbi:MAG: hypothetical protein ACOYM2_02215 [Rectinemataceae bacterium]